MNGRQTMRRCFISLLLLLIGTSLAVAQPFTRRSTDHAKSMGESAMKAATGVFTPKS